MTANIETVTVAPHPSVAYRTALRRAVRAHPNYRGPNVSTLSMAQLEDAARGLTIDLDRVRSDILRAGILSTPAPDPLADGTEDTAPAEDSTEGQDEAQDDAQDTAEGQEDTEAQAIAAEVQAVRGLILSGGFASLDARLTELVREARKPAVIERVTVSTGSTQARPHQAKLTSRTSTWAKGFRIAGALGKRSFQFWDGSHPDTPALNSNYVWPQPQSAVALTQLARQRNVLFFGAPGTGKTEWAAQFAAVTQRPFSLISCDNGTDAATLVGMTVPSADGGVTWQDGQLTRALRTPGCLICVDEPSVARPGALFVLQNVLQNRTLHIAETGELVRAAPGVLIIAADNTNGTGGGARNGYTDTNRLNAAFLSRFGAKIRFEYMTPGNETAALVAYTGCPAALADLLVTAANVTRAQAEQQALSAGIGFRALLSWTEMLMDGIGPETAFEAAVLHAAPESDLEPLRQQCLLAYDRSAVASALATTGPVPVPSASAAAADFSLVSPDEALLNFR